MNQTIGRQSTISLRTVLLLAGVGVLILVCLLDFRSTLSEHEVFAAQPARHMLEGGSWLLQSFAGEYRTKKPPGQSWLIAASMFITQTQSDFTARLPAALASIGLAVLAAWWASRISSALHPDSRDHDRAGLIAGLMMLSCYGVQLRGRSAEADIPFSFFIGMAMTLAVMTASAGPDPARTSRWRTYGLVAGFWCCVAFAFVIKGPFALGLTLPAVVVAMGFTRSRSTLIALALTLVPGLLLVLAWPAAAYVAHPQILNQWRVEVVDRVAGEIRSDSLAAYLWLIPSIAAPWVLFSAAAIGRCWRGRQDPLIALTLAWIVCGVVVLSCVSFKRMHYALPLLVPVIAMSAFGFDVMLRSWIARRPARSPWLAIGVWFVPACSAWLINQAFVLPRNQIDTRVTDFAEQVNQIVPASNTITIYRVGEDRTAWYLRSPLRREDQPWKALPSPPPEFVVTYVEFLPQLQALAAETAVELARGLRYREKSSGPDERRVLVQLRAAGATP